MQKALDGRDRLTALAVVVALYAMAAAWLLRGGRLPTGERPADDVLQIEFIAPRGHARVHAVAATPADQRSRSVGVTTRPAASRAPSGEAPSAAAPGVVASGTANRPLDLRIPEAPLVRNARDPLERTIPLAAQRTRFEDHWAPPGNVLEQAAFRSRTAALALHAFGGPPRHCDEIERRRRVANCLPLTGHEDEDERLRRSLDP